MYRNLLRRESAGKRGGGAVAKRFPAVQVAVEQDLQPEDTVRVASRTSRTGASAATTRDFLDVFGIGVRNGARKNGKIVVVWAEQADPELLREALEGARMHKLPILFVTDAEKDPGQLLNRKVRPGEEMPHIAVDGNDVVAAYRVAHEAIERARRGRGPTLMECAGFQVKGKRSAEHLDPVANLERYMEGRGVPVKGKAKKDSQSRGGSRS